MTINEEFNFIKIEQLLDEIEVNSLEHRKIDKHIENISDTLKFVKESRLRSHKNLMLQNSRQALIEYVLDIVNTAKLRD